MVRSPSEVWQCRSREWKRGTKRRAVGMLSLDILVRGFASTTVTRQGRPGQAHASKEIASAIEDLNGFSLESSKCDSDV